MISSYRRSSAEPGQQSSSSSASSAAVVSAQNNNESVTIVEECSKDQGVIRRFSKGKFLGKGGFAKCYEFTNLETRKTIAAKVIPKSSLTKSRARQKLMSEIKIHRSLKHTNIVGFEHFFEDHENVYILLELCTNQTMNELLKRRKRLTEIEVQCYLTQILSSIKHLHKHRVIHRDLKLGNLFLSDRMEIKLGDFGLATKLDYEGERKRTICGTPNYIAPEILEGKESGHSYEVDVWSFGVIAYTLLIGKPPFETNDVKTTYKRIRMNEYSFPEGVQISSAAKNMIKRILLTDPLKRLTVDEIISHEFFTCSGSIPKLLPVSTLACPPSSSYIRSFQQPQSQSIPSSQSQQSHHHHLHYMHGDSQHQQYQERHLGSTHTVGYVGRSNSPRRFENTTPLSSHHLPLSSTNTAAATAHSASSSNNIRSQQQMAIATASNFNKENRKETGGTYRTASATTSSAYSQSHAAMHGKNFDSNNVNNKRIEDDLSPNPHGVPVTSAVVPSSTQPILQLLQQNMNGSGNVQQYIGKSHLNGMQQQQQQVTSQNYQPNSSMGSLSSQIVPPTRNSLEKYSSSSNANTAAIAANLNHHAALASSSSAANASVPASGNVRAKSEKMYTQPQSTVGTNNNNNNNSNTGAGASNPLLMASSGSSYGVVPFQMGATNGSGNTQNMLTGIAQLAGNLSGTNLLLKQTSTQVQSDGLLLVASDIYVKKWVDYSAKYGLGYLLSNGQVGVFFNDSTKIILNAANEEFEYYERKSSEKQDVGQTHKVNAYPSELQKKVLLLQHFKSYLQGDDKQIECSVQPMLDEQQLLSNGLANGSGNAVGNSKIYLKKWLRSKDAILFRLSNKVVQVIFLDKTEVILSNEMRVVTYVNKRHERLTYPLTSAMESTTNPEMAKRLRYTKEILTHMLNNGATSAAATAAAAGERSTGTTSGTRTAGSTRTTSSKSTSVGATANQNTALTSADSKVNIIKSNIAGQNGSSSLSNTATQGQQHMSSASQQSLIGHGIPSNSKSSQSQQSVHQQSQQRENLHFSKNAFQSYSQLQQQPSSQLTNPSNPPLIPSMAGAATSTNSNYQNENVNTYGTGSKSSMQNQGKSSLSSVNTAGTMSGKKENGGISSYTSTSGVANSSSTTTTTTAGLNSQQPNLLKSTSSLVRMNSLNAINSASAMTTAATTATSGTGMPVSSLSNLNHFNNYIITSRKTEV